MLDLRRSRSYFKMGKQQLGVVGLNSQLC
jgi:hypothetical protein